MQDKAIATIGRWQLEKENLEFFDSQKLILVIIKYEQNRI